jgi:hypothetical protein
MFPLPLTARWAPLPLHPAFNWTVARPTSSFRSRVSAFITLGNDLLDYLVDPAILNHQGFINLPGPGLGIEERGKVREAARQVTTSHRMAKRGWNGGKW